MIPFTIAYLPQKRNAWGGLFFAPPETVEKVAGHFFEKELRCVLRLRRSKVRLPPFPPDGKNYGRSLAPPLPTQTASLGLCGDPTAAKGGQFDAHSARSRSVKKICRWHIFSIGRSGYAARKPCYRVAQKMILPYSPPPGGELCEAFSTSWEGLFFAPPLQLPAGTDII